MIYEHITITLNRFIESEENKIENKLILFDDNVENENYKILAQVISLDIRGNYGLFINKRDAIKEWTGNLFKIIVSESKVRMIDISEDEEYVVDKCEWEEALEDWKSFYLSELGFLAYSQMALNHMFGVLLLTYDQMGDNICEKEMIIEAIKRSALRYGISVPTIYRDCKKVTYMISIDGFYRWVKELLEANFNRYNNEDYKKNPVYSSIQLELENYFGIH